MSKEQIMQKCQSVFKNINNIEKLTKAHNSIIQEELKRAKYWVENFAPENRLFEIPKTTSEALKSEIPSPMIPALKKLLAKIENEPTISEQGLQNYIFQVTTDIKDIPVKEFFKEVYKILLNKPYGPRLGAFLLSLDRDWVIQRFKNVL
jgi:lysyl-tRNA synthetase class 1